jgi:hypothetical protein
LFPQWIESDGAGAYGGAAAAGPRGSVIAETIEKDETALPYGD